MPNDYQLSLLAQASYSDDPGDVAGFELLATSSSVPGDFFAAAFCKRDADGDVVEIVIAFRGSEAFFDLLPDVALAGLTDWDSQFSSAIAFARGLLIQYPEAEIWATGHSLGGSLAQVVAYMFGLDGAAFDPGGALNLVASEEFEALRDGLEADPELAASDIDFGSGAGPGFTNYFIQDSIVSGWSGNSVNHSNTEILDFFAYAEPERIVIESSTAVAEFGLSLFGVGFLAPLVTRLLTTAVFHSIDGIVDLMAVRTFGQFDQNSNLYQSSQQSVEYLNQTGNIGFSDDVPGNSQALYSLHAYRPYLVADNGDNNIEGTPADDTIFGLEGDDIVSNVFVQRDSEFLAILHSDVASLGEDIVDGGAGIDTVVLDWSELTEPILWDLQTGSYSGPGSWTSFERFGMLKTGSGDDIIITSTLMLSNIIGTGPGDDAVTVNGNNEILWGGVGNDTLTIDFSWAVEDVDTYIGNGSIIPGLEQPYVVRSFGIYVDGGPPVAFVESVEFENYLIKSGTGDDQLITGAGHDTIDAGTGNDYIDVGDGNDTVLGGEGDDEIRAGTGVDAIDGGSGSNHLNIDRSYLTANVVFDGIAAASSDGIELADGSSIANIQSIWISAGSGNDTIDLVIGPAFSDTIATGSGDDEITVGGGYDLVWGGAGNDTLTVDFSWSSDRVETTLASWSDPPFSGMQSPYVFRSFGLRDLQTNNNLDSATAADIENFVIKAGSADDTLITEAGDDTIHGGAGSDYIEAGAGNDILLGGAGDDAMTGGLGDDTFYVDADGDGVVELAGQGTDRVSASGTYFLSLTAEVELIESANQSLTTALNLGGSDTANTIHGNDGANFLYGLGAADTLWGFGGADYLVGGTGADVMYGGLGNDTYYIDVLGDLIYELAGEGTDRVAPSISYTLPDNAEVELVEAVNLTATDALNLGGSNFANTLYGNNGANFLYGYLGNDWLWGFGGGDYLVGGVGNDVMYGGLGNDVYYVDSSGDLVYELAGEGSDRVAAEITLDLPDNAEIELLEAVNLTTTERLDLGGSDTANTIAGNDGVNVIHGRAGNDVLYGRAGDDYLAGDAGNDTMSGGAGNDTYYVDSAGDAIVELAGEGTDRVVASASYALAGSASVELIETTDDAGSSAIALTGSDTVNTIRGNAGANTIDGRSGNDWLWGLGGADTFAFTAALGAGNVDSIADFQPGSDTLALDDAIFTGLAAGALAAGAFKIGPAANEADDRIVYDSSTGALLYDADGDGAGAAVQFAALSAGLSLAAADFAVI